MLRFIRMSLLALAIILSEPTYSLFAEENPLKDSISLSIIIPCYHKHAIHLYPLLRLLETQTVLPDEVIISLSQSGLVGSNIFNTLMHEKWAFPVKLIHSKHRFFAGRNRNIACQYASGDIFMGQDADDLPHPRRVEIVKHFFKRYDLDFLMHKFAIRKCNEPINMPGIGHVIHIRHRNPISFDDAVNIGNVTNGNIAIARHVFEQCSWPCDPRAEDLRYNRILFERFKKRLVLEVPLLLYREYLSSCDGKREHDIYLKDEVSLETKRLKSFTLEIISYDVGIV